MTSEDVARRHSMSDVKAGQLKAACSDPEFAADLFNRMLSESMSVIQSAYKALEAASSRAPEPKKAEPKKSASKKSTSKKQ